MFIAQPDWLSQSLCVFVEADPLCAGLTRCFLFRPWTFLNSEPMWQTWFEFPIRQTSEIFGRNIETNGTNLVPTTPKEAKEWKPSFFCVFDQSLLSTVSHLSLCSSSSSSSTFFLLSSSESESSSDSMPPALSSRTNSGSCKQPRTNSSTVSSPSPSMSSSPKIFLARSADDPCLPRKRRKWWQPWANQERETIFWCLEK